MTQHYLYDGVKSIPMNKLPPEAWLPPSERDEGSGDNLSELYAKVSFMFRCIEIRANAISGLPWAIMRGETDVWTSEETDPPDELAMFDDLPDLLWQTDASLCLRSDAFWHKERNPATITGIRWLQPSSIEPEWTAAGLQRFWRRIGTQKIPLPVDDVVYIWLRGQSETKPRTPAAKAAMNAAGVLYNADLFSKGFFARGAVKASVLSLPEDTSDTDARELKAWWKRLFSGIAEAWNAEIVRGKIEVATIGEGIGELSDSDLTATKREDIATAMGVPHSIVLSNAANYATSQQDEMNFYNLTVVPESKILQRQMNRQLFEELGYRFEFRPQELSLYQEDEEQRAQSLKLLVDAGMPLPVALEILGFQLPEGMKYEDLEEPEPEPVVIQPIPGQPQAMPNGNGNGARQEEIRTFRRWAGKRTNPNVDNFKSDILSRADKLALLEDGVADDAPFPAHIAGWEDYP